MQVMPPGGQICNQILVAKLATNSSRDTEINFELFWLKDLLKFWNQCPGSVVPLAMFLQSGPKGVNNIGNTKNSMKKLKRQNSLFLQGEISS